MMTANDNVYRRPHSAGFTLIEIVLVIVIIGILATVAMRSGRAMYDTARVEQTKEELSRPATDTEGIE